MGDYTNWINKIFILKNYNYGSNQRQKGNINISYYINKQQNDVIVPYGRNGVEERIVDLKKNNQKVTKS